MEAESFLKSLHGGGEDTAGIAFDGVALKADRACEADFFQLAENDADIVGALVEGLNEAVPLGAGKIGIGAVDSDGGEHGSSFLEEFGDGFFFAHGQGMAEVEGDTKGFVVNGLSEFGSVSEFGGPLADVRIDGDAGVVV